MTGCTTGVLEVRGAEKSFPGVKALDGVPSQPHTFYIGVVNGGVWKTTDAGANWVNVSDGQITVGSMGDIDVSDSDPNVIYAGMGETAIRGNVSHGDGVYKSTDGGKKWQILRGQQTTDKNPVGNAFGPGYTGVSGGGKTPQWVQEKIDLTPFAGKKILLRFEYVTDDAVNGPGMLIDDISIPEIGYSDDAEKGKGGWEAAGWVRTDNRLAQRWLVQLLEIGSDGTVSLQRVPINPEGRGQVTVSRLDGLREAVLVVSAIAPTTTERATYSYTIAPK